MMIESGRPTYRRCAPASHVSTNAHGRWWKSRTRPVTLRRNFASRVSSQR